MNAALSSVCQYDILTKCGFVYNTPTQCVFVHIILPFDTGKICGY